MKRLLTKKQYPFILALALQLPVLVMAIDIRGWSYGLDVLLALRMAAVLFFPVGLLTGFLYFREFKKAIVYAVLTALIFVTVVEIVNTGQEVIAKRQHECPHHETRWLNESNGFGCTTEGLWYGHD